MGKNVRMFYINQRIKVRGKCPLTLYLSGANDRTRTGDLRITSALLYQLSHVGLIKLAKYSSNNAGFARSKFEAFGAVRCFSQTSGSSNRKFSLGPDRSRIG